MPGSQVFTFFNLGKETVKGTPVATTRQMYPGSTGILDIDFGLNIHDGENSGVRTPVRRVTSTQERVNASATVEGIGYDDLVIPFSQLKGAVAGVGGAADKTWTYAPSMVAANAPESYSIDCGDDTQNWRLQYAMMRSFRLSAGLGDVTALEMNWFAQRAIKTAKSSPSLNSAVKIPGDGWTYKVAASIAGLAGAAVVANSLIDWELEVNTGLMPDFSMDGNLYFGQHVESQIRGKLNMTLESTSANVTEFYDKSAAGTQSFVRLKSTGPVLGGSFYSAQIDVPVFYTKVNPIASAAENGVNLYRVEAEVSYDSVSAASIQAVLVNSLTALP